jgi:hypothetical protein
MAQCLETSRNRNRASVELLGAALRAVPTHRLCRCGVPYRTVRAQRSTVRSTRTGKARPQCMKQWAQEPPIEGWFPPFCRGEHTTLRSHWGSQAAFDFVVQTATFPIG